MSANFIGCSMKNISTSSFRPISQQLFEALLNGGDKTALELGKAQYSYSELRDLVFAFAFILSEHKVSRLGILSHRSLEVYRALLGSIISGCTNVPLNPIFPKEKTAFIIEHSQCSHIFIAPECVDYAIKLLKDVYPKDKLINLKLLVSKQVQELLISADASWGKLTVVYDECSQGGSWGSSGESIVEHLRAVKVAENDILHILYTSGTTGQPKGVMVSQGNYAYYFEQINKLYEFKSSDVFSHFAEITFDINLQDPLCALINHGTLVCPTKADLLTPHRFIRAHNITVIHAVPSLINYMRKIKALDKEHNETLRLSIFIGEALWYQQLVAFNKAYPCSRIINTYGPTETTVAVSYYEVKPEQLADTKLAQNIVPLGVPFGETKFIVCDEHKNEVKDGEYGELCIGGPQLTLGYYRNNAKNQEAFFEHEGERWYATGDQVQSFAEVLIADCAQGHKGQSIKNFNYIGRNDDMIKLHGYRISLYEIEEQLGKLTNLPVKAIPASTIVNGIPEMILIAAIEGASAEHIAALEQSFSQKLVFYMVPKYTLSLSVFPLNSNGKVDRKKLRQQALAQLKLSLGISFDAT